MRYQRGIRIGIGIGAFAFLSVIIAAAVFVSVSVADAESGLPFGLDSAFSSGADSEQVAAGPQNGPGGQNSAVVEVVMEPQLCNGGRLRFSGVPSGVITLGECEPGEPAPVRRLSSSALPPGEVESTLTYIDPSISNLGYELAEIRCDDGSSQAASAGDLETRKATFGIDAGESVTCTFVLAVGSACLCPKEGKWNVKNNAGLMECTGSFSYANRLDAGTTSGTIEIRDSCDTLIAEGMSPDEATITYRRTSGCDYKGTVGSDQFGVPLTIHFTLDIENPERMTGSLTSTMSQQGTTCNMNRTYEMDFAGQ